MNLILIHAGELTEGHRVLLTDRRAHHLHHVLHASVGQTVRIGLVNGALGSAAIEAIDSQRAVLRCQFEDVAPEPSGDVLLLAIPRPKILLRCIEHAAALGFSRIVLFRSWRVDKAHLHAKALAPEVLTPRLFAGLEQARRTHVPEVLVQPLFRPFVEDVLDALVPAHRYLADPGAARCTAELSIEPRPFALVLGPERGLTSFEFEMFAVRGFEPIRLHAHPLRVETALAVLHGQLDLLRTIARRQGSNSVP